MRSPDWRPAASWPRQTGRTTALVAATKAIGGTLVVRNDQEVKRLTREFGISAFSARGNPDELRGRLVPVLFDPDAVGIICNELHREIDALSISLATAESEVVRLSGELAQAMKVATEAIAALNANMEGAPR